MKTSLRKRISLRFTILFIGVLTTLISCDKDDAKNEIDTQSKVEEQLINTFNNGVLPLNLSFVSATETLKNSIATFNEESTLADLEIVQNHWVDMLKIWKQLELYNLGLVEDSFIHFEINRWETNTGNVDDYILGTETLNETFINGIGSSSKGISAMEYLLFSDENNDTVLSSFTTNSNAERTLNYLKALSENLATKSNELYSIWENYEIEFTSSLESGINGSQNQLTNAMITLIEEIIISKLGDPLGDKTGGVIDVEALEAYRSRSSLIIIQEHLNELKNCYDGDFIQNSNDIGYDDHLVLIGKEDLDTLIVNAFSLCQEKLDAISSSLYVELTENHQNVTDLQDAFSDLLVLIKVDMASAIGTTVTVNDNDGD